MLFVKRVGKKNFGVFSCKHVFSDPNALMAIFGDYACPMCGFINRVKEIPMRPLTKPRIRP